MSANVVRGIILCLGIFFLVAGAIVYAVVPYIVRNALEEAVKWKQDDKADSDSWFNASEGVITYQRIFVFNCTNVDDVEAGAVPKLRRLGPYTYRRNMYKKRETIVWNENNGTVSFGSKSNPIFQKAMSVMEDGTQLSETDLIYNFNMPLNVLGLMAGSQCEKGNFALWGGLPILKAMTRNKMYMPMTAFEAIWGTQYSILKAVGMSPAFAAYNPIDEPVPSEYLTGTGPLTAPGLEDYKSTSWITKYRGMSSFPYWATAEANAVRGFTTQFPAFDTLDEKPFLLFTSSLFRTLDMVYQKDVDLYGLTLKRYVISDTSLKTNPHYYMSADGYQPVPPSLGLPVLLTRHQYYGADKSILNIEVDGHNPPLADEETNNVHLDVQGHTGYPFRVHNRLQINAPFGPFMCNGSAMSFSAKYSPTVHPLLAVAEEHSATEEDVDDFKKLIFLPLRLATGFGIAGIVIGAVGIIAVLISFALGNGSQGEGHPSHPAGAVRVDSPDALSPSDSKSKNKGESTTISVVPSGPTDDEADVVKPRDDEAKETPMPSVENALVPPAVKNEEEHNGLAVEREHDVKPTEDGGDEGTNNGTQEMATLEDVK
eukprot:PhM_4_TR10101/c0_g1_i1/m.31313/K12384/SCARB2, LIMP2, CD36L2; lysosome membrane protein 2